MAGLNLIDYDLFSIQPKFTIHNGKKTLNNIYSKSFSIVFLLCTTACMVYNLVNYFEKEYNIFSLNLKTINSLISNSSSNIASNTTRESEINENFLMIYSLKTYSPYSDLLSEVRQLISENSIVSIKEVIANNSSYYSQETEEIRILNDIFNLFNDSTPYISSFNETSILYSHNNENTSSSGSGTSSTTSYTLIKLNQSEDDGQEILLPINLIKTCIASNLGKFFLEVFKIENLIFSNLNEKRIIQFLLEKMSLFGIGVERINEVLALIEFIEEKEKTISYDFYDLEKIGSISQLPFNFAIEIFYLYHSFMLKLVNQKTSFSFYYDDNYESNNKLISFETVFTSEFNMHRLENKLLLHDYNSWSKVNLKSYFLLNYFSKSESYSNSYVREFTDKLFELSLITKIIDNCIFLKCNSKKNEILLRETTNNYYLNNYYNTEEEETKFLRHSYTQYLQISNLNQEILYSRSKISWELVHIFLFSFIFYYILKLIFNPIEDFLLKNYLLNSFPNILYNFDYNTYLNNSNLKSFYLGKPISYFSPRKNYVNNPFNENTTNNKTEKLKIINTLKSARSLSNNLENK